MASQCCRSSKPVSIGQWRAELKVNHPPVMVNSSNTGANYDEVFHAYGM